MAPHGMSAGAYSTNFPGIKPSRNTFRDSFAMHKLLAEGVKTIASGSSLSLLSACLNCLKYFHNFLVSQPLQSLAWPRLIVSQSGVLFVYRLQVLMVVVLTAPMRLTSQPMGLVRPPDCEFPIGLTNLNHDVPRWGVTPKLNNSQVGGGPARPSVGRCQGSQARVGWRE